MKMGDGVPSPNTMSTMSLGVSITSGTGRVLNANGVILGYIRFCVRSHDRMLLHQRMGGGPPHNTGNTRREYAQRWTSRTLSKSTPRRYSSSLYFRRPGTRSGYIGISVTWLRHTDIRRYLDVPIREFPYDTLIL